MLPESSKIQKRQNYENGTPLLIWPYQDMAFHHDDPKKTSLPFSSHLSLVTLKYSISLLLPRRTLLCLLSVWVSEPR